MKTFLFIAALVSNFALAQVDGLSIGNAHQVDKSGNVFRGKEPKGKVTELAHIGITNVIIFKNDVKGEVGKEIEALKELGITSHHIPFRWKEYPSVVEACEQFVEAITIIRDVKEKNGKTFFHCTAGEDRTGALAGLYRMLEEGVSRETVFKNEMCARHYSDASPHKPSHVSAAIQKELTPIFLALAAKIEKGEWKLDKLSKASCQNLTVEPTTLRCRR